MYMENFTITTKPIIIHNENFQTILIDIMFPYQEKTEDLAKQALLPAMLNYMTEKYPTERNFQNTLKENYVLSYSVDQKSIGTTAFINFQLTIPDKKALKKDVLESQIKLLSEAIYYPKTKNNAFDAFEFNREKENLKLRMNNNEKSFKPYLNRKVRELVDTEGIFSKSLYNHQNLIEETTEKNLYDYYKERILKTTPIIFVMGNITEEEINPIIEKYFPTTKKTQSIKTDYFHYLEPFKTKPQEITEEKEFRDSALTFIYKVKNMKKEDTILLTLINNLLTSLSSRLLEKKLRTEYNLIYYCEVIPYPRYGLLKIIIYINPKNKELAQEKVLETMEILKDEQQISPLLEKIKERKRVDLLRNLDNKYAIINDAINKELNITYTQEKRYELLKEKTANDIKNFMERLSLDTIYFLKEKEHE